MANKKNLIKTAIRKILDIKKNYYANLLKLRAERLSYAKNRKQEEAIKQAEEIRDKIKNL